MRVSLVLFVLCLKTLVFVYYIYYIYTIYIYYTHFIYRIYIIYCIYYTSYIYIYTLYIVYIYNFIVYSISTIYTCILVKFDSIGFSTVFKHKKKHGFFVSLLVEQHRKPVNNKVRILKQQIYRDLYLYICTIHVIVHLMQTYIYHSNVLKHYVLFLFCCFFNVILFLCKNIVSHLFCGLLLKPTVFHAFSLLLC